MTTAVHTTRGPGAHPLLRAAKPLSRLALGLLVIVAMLAALLGILSATSGAAQTPEQMIVSPALPSSWSQVTDNPALNRIGTTIQQLDNNALGSSGHVQVATRFWESSDKSQLLAIILVDWPSNVSNLPKVLNAGIKNECVSLVGHDPSTIQSVANVPNGNIASCSSQGNSVLVEDTIRGHYTAMVESLGYGGPTLNRATMEATLASQYKKLPKGNSTLGTAVGVVIFLLILAGGVFGAVRLILRWRRRDRAVDAPNQPAAEWGDIWGGQSPPGYGQGYGTPTGVPTHTYAQPQGADSMWPGQAPAAYDPSASSHPAMVMDQAPGEPPARAVGWHDVDGDTYHRRYWDGQSWTSEMRWRGNEWVQTEG
jgi:hypothetical protein